mmetsp:Transcript_12838/g.35553  ORF Transcript_12838/g.35553 Transcript_12838/m.35553 type:complete len:111 (-) Transcript_12838:5188-5520(-)
MKAISVQATYRIRGEESKVVRVDASNVIENRIGLEPGVSAVKPEAGSYVYSGMHDQGVMVEPKEGGVMSSLVGCLMSAKEENNKYLTSVIDDEKVSNIQGKEPISKKVKT